MKFCGAQFGKMFLNINEYMTIINEYTATNQHLDQSCDLTIE